MFVHVSILTYELDLNLYDVVSESMGLLNLEYKKLKTKEEVDGFMKDWYFIFFIFYSFTFIIIIPFQ